MRTNCPYIMIPTIIVVSITVISIVLSLLFFPSIKIGKFKLSLYWIFALLGALVLLFTSLSPFNIVLDGLTSNNSVNPLKIITLFFSMTILSIYLDEVGLFKYLASIAIKRANNNQFILFTIFYTLTSILTVFTSNDVVILTFTPFICFFCKNTNVNPLPYLVSEFIAANTWSLLLMIGNPTNIYLASNANITFFDYLSVMALPTVIGGIIEYILLILVFYKKLKQPMICTYEEYKIENKTSLIIGLIHLFVCLIFLILSSYITIEMYLISLICASSLIIISIVISLITKKGINYTFKSFKRLPYPLIPFFLSMFIIVTALNYQGISIQLSNILGTNNVIYTYGYSSFVASNIINNIPMSILYAELSTPLIGSSIYYEAVYASIIGSNIGAFLTPIGALAGIMFTSLVNEHNIRYRFIDFVKYGVVIAIPVISVMLVMLDVVI